MAITRRTITATPEEVFAVLLDPYCYPKWVVGAKAIRAVDEGWPAPGSSFHHRLGATPLVEIRDRSEVLALDAPRGITLRTFLRPLGIARVDIRVVPTGDEILVELKEVLERNTLLRNIARLLDPFIHFRNTESLRRLEKIVTEKAQEDAGASSKEQTPA